MSTNPIARFALPAAAIGLFGFAVVSTIRPDPGRADPPIAPPTSSFSAAVAGIGVVEPESEMIAVASDLPGVVRDVLVRPGDDVAKGAPLFRLDGRAQQAALNQALASAEAARAAAQAAKVAFDDETQRLSLFEAVADPRAISADELARRQFGAERAKAAYAQALAQVKTAEAQAGVMRTELERLTVRAPIAGRVFSVDVRPGEFAAAGPVASPLMTMGAAKRLHVRVEIDETDIARVERNAAAFGTLRGRADAPVPLSFVRFEPQAVEKRAMAGGSERVDTRVIEAIYAFEPSAADAFVGRRMDVFIEAAPLQTVARTEAQP
jgi:multidrug efflux pump subunit AcrA (membrane-fusion protein)